MSDVHVVCTCVCVWPRQAERSKQGVWSVRDSLTDCGEDMVVGGRALCGMRRPGGRAQRARSKNRSEVQNGKSDHLKRGAKR